MIRRLPFLLAACLLAAVAAVVFALPEDEKGPAKGEEKSSGNDPTKTTVTELAPGVYFRKTQTKPVFIGSNNGIVVFKDFVLVIDANFPGQAQEVIKLVKTITDKPIRYVFDTHHHGDHADGNVRFTEIGATAVASERSQLLFETKGREGFERAKTSKPDEYGKLEYATPSMYFHDRLVLDDGEQRVEFLWLGHGHTAGDAVAWLPEHGVLFTGDACVNGAFNYTGDSDTASWINLLSSLQELPVKYIGPGHGELAGKELLDKQKSYFVELRAAVKKLIDKGRTLDQIKAEIDLPSYKEWTGVDVKMQTENIEHVYGELTKGT
jgi:glyoxylase-like metal-dependent hydrolase (beta-lactamase superfamily II)